MQHPWTAKIVDTPVQRTLCGLWLTVPPWLGRVATLRPGAAVDQPGEVSSELMVRDGHTIPAIRASWAAHANVRGGCPPWLSGLRGSWSALRGNMRSRPDTGPPWVGPVTQLSSPPGKLVMIAGWAGQNCLKEPHRAASSQSNSSLWGKEWSELASAQPVVWRVPVPPGARGRGRGRGPPAPRTPWAPAPRPRLSW